MTISRGHLAETAIVGAALLAWIALAAASVAPDASVYDEHPHIVSGYAHLASGRFSGGLDNPPLLQLLLVLPAWIAGVPYQPYVDAHLWWFRLPAIAIGALTGLLVYVYSRSLHGPRGAALSLFLFCFCATSLGLARYAVLDFGAASFLLLALFAADRYLAQRSARRLALAGVACGAAVGVKYTLLPLWGLVPLLVLLAPRTPRAGKFRAAGRRRAKTIEFARGRLFPAAALAAVALLTLDAAFLFQGVLAYKPLAEPLRGDLAPATARALELASPLLPTELQRGIAGKLAQAAAGRPTFLLGEWRPAGAWYYFPVALWLKTSVALHAALALLAVQLVRRRARFGFRHAVLWLPTAVLFVSLFGSQINIGVRHVVFVLPVLFVLLGALAVDRDAARAPLSRVALAALAALALAYAAGSAAVFPHYLEFFNAAAGGPPNGYRQLVDSSLDWGQDDDLPARFARERGIAALRINESPFEARAGWLALSANAYQGVYHREPGLDGRRAWRWATKLAPRARLAHTWFVYEIGEPDLRAYALAHPDDAEAWVDLGQVLLAARDLAGARAAFERADEIGGGERVEPALRLAQLALAAGDAPAALPAIDRALRGAPRSREIQRWGAIARADAWLAALANADDRSEWAAAMADKLQATCELRDRDACRRVFEALRAAPVESAAWWHGIGVGHLALGELDSARAAFARAAALAPESDADRATAAVAARLAEAARSPRAQDHTELASALARMGLFRLAMDQYLAAHALDPGAPAPLWAMGELQIARRLGRSPFAWP